MSNLTTYDADAEAKAIGELYRSSATSLKAAVLERLEAGRRLIIVKKQVGHGYWLAWLDHNRSELGFGESAAKMLMAGFKKHGGLLSNRQSTSDLTEADALKISKAMWYNERKALPAPVEEDDTDLAPDELEALEDEGGIDPDIGDISPDNYRTAFYMRCDDAQQMAKQCSKIFDELRDKMKRLRGVEEMATAVRATAAAWNDLAQKIGD